MTAITIPATQVRKNLFDLLDKLNNPAFQVTITYRGKPRAVLVNSEEFDSRQETLEIMSDKSLIKDIKEAEKDFKKGDYKTFEEVFGKTPSQVLNDKKDETTSSYSSKKSRKTTK